MACCEKLKQWRAAVKKWRKAGKPKRHEYRIKWIFDYHCERCDHRCKKKCLVCGCKVHPTRRNRFNKIAMATEHCPEDKW